MACNTAWPDVDAMEASGRRATDLIKGSRVAQDGEAMGLAFELDRLKRRHAEELRQFEQRANAAAEQVRRSGALVAEMRREVMQVKEASARDLAELREELERSREELQEYRLEIARLKRAEGQQQLLRTSPRGAPGVQSIAASLLEQLEEERAAAAREAKRASTLEEEARSLRREVDELGREARELRARVAAAEFDLVAKDLETLQRMLREEAFATATVEPGATLAASWPSTKVDGAGDPFLQHIHRTQRECLNEIGRYAHAVAHFQRYPLGNRARDLWERGHFVSFTFWRELGGGNCEDLDTVSREAKAAFEDAVKGGISLESLSLGLGRVMARFERVPAFRPLVQRALEAAQQRVGKAGMVEEPLYGLTEDYVAACKKEVCDSVIRVLQVEGVLPSELPAGPGRVPQLRAAHTRVLDNLVTAMEGARRASGSVEGGGGCPTKELEELRGALKEARELVGDSGGAVVAGATALLEGNGEGPPPQALPSCEEDRPKAGVEEAQPAATEPAPPGDLGAVEAAPAPREEASQEVVQAEPAPPPEPMALSASPEAPPAAAAPQVVGEAAAEEVSDPPQPAPAAEPEAAPSDAVAPLQEEEAPTPAPPAEPQTPSPPPDCEPPAAAAGQEADEAPPPVPPAGPQTPPPQPLDCEPPAAAAGQEAPSPEPPGGPETQPPPPPPPNCEPPAAAAEQDASEAPPPEPPEGLPPPPPLPGEPLAEAAGQGAGEAAAPLPSLDLLFARAVDLVREAKQLRRLKESDALRLDSLGNQATRGDVAGPKPGKFDPVVARQRWDAWSKLKGMDCDAAKSAYCGLVAELLPDSQLDPGVITGAQVLQARGPGTVPPSPSGGGAPANLDADGLGAGDREQKAVEPTEAANLEGDDLGLAAPEQKAAVLPVPSIVVKPPATQASPPPAGSVESSPSQTKEAEPEAETTPRGTGYDQAAEQPEPEARQRPAQLEAELADEVLSQSDGSASVQASPPRRDKWAQQMKGHHAAGGASLKSRARSPQPPSPSSG